MKRYIAIVLVAGGLQGLAQAGLHGDLPDSRHAWSVHDVHRPLPVKISAAAGKVPSDAIVLFDGTQKSVNEHWHNWGKPTGWVATNGMFLCVPGKGGACTKRSFGDCQLHIEWMAPLGSKGYGQHRGNSGVFLMNKYEIQVLDSFDTDPAFPKKNPNYADGLAGAVYGQNPPMVNPSRPAGEWQTYDIIFHQPVWEGDKLLYPGSMTVFFNGVLVQDHWELEGPTYYVQRTSNSKHPDKAPLSLQDHGNPVPYRNIWIREIPSRYANTTHGGAAVKTEEVLALRAKTAEKLVAKIDASRPLGSLLGAWAEVLAYDAREEYRKEYEQLAKKYIQEIKAYDQKAYDCKHHEMNSINRDYMKLVKAGVQVQDLPLRGAINDVNKKFSKK